MVLNWFRKDEFRQFSRLVERLQKHVRIADRELLIEHFVELRRHFRKIKAIYPKLKKLYHEEQKLIEFIPEFGYRRRLKQLSSDFFAMLFYPRVLSHNLKPI